MFKFYKIEYLKTLIMVKMHHRHTQPVPIMAGIVYVVCNYLNNLYGMLTKPFLYVREYTKSHALIQILGDFPLL